MLPEYFAFIAIVIASIGTVQYLFLTIKGRVKPNKVTFFFWGLFPLIAFFAQSSVEVSSVVWITLAMGVMPFVILAASYFNPDAYWKIKQRDYILGAIAICSMILWYASKDANLAIIFALAADFFASLPTILKSYNYPSTEDWKPYAVNALGFFMGVLAVQEWVFAEYVFVVYFFFITVLISAVIYFRSLKI